MRVILPICFLVILTTVLSGCLHQNIAPDDHPLARVQDKYLYRSDLTGLVPPGTNIKDSIVLAKNYIDNWIRERLLLNIAEKNLLAKDLRFQKKLEDYRKSLIIYEYESKLVRQNLDTVVTQKEIEEYFNENIDNFRLKTNIVRAVYARFPIKDDAVQKVRRFFYSSQPSAGDSLEVYFMTRAETFNLNDEKWIPFDELLRIIPVKTTNKEAYLRQTKKTDFGDEVFHYFLALSEYLLINDLPPVTFEKEHICQIILNRRKIQLIRETREEIFSKALQNNEFEIY